MNDIMEYIGVAGLVAIPVMLNEDQIESVKRRNGSIKIIALFAVCEYSLLGFVLVPMLFENFLAGGFLDKLVYYVYICVNFFVQLLLIYKRGCRSTINEVYNILKYIWIIGIIAYTVILGVGNFFQSWWTPVLSASIFVLYNCSAICFDFFIKGQPFELSEGEEKILYPLKEISAEQYRIWFKEREMKVRKISLLLASGFLIICDVVFYFAVVQEITWLIVLVMALIYFGGMGTLVRQWNIKIKDIENRKIESVFRGKALVEITLPFQVRYMDSEGEYQSRVVEKKQRRKEKQGTLVDIIVENGEIVLAEKTLPE